MTRRRNRRCMLGVATLWLAANAARAQESPASPPSAATATTPSDAAEAAPQSPPPTAAVAPEPLQAAPAASPARPPAQPATYEKLDAGPAASPQLHPTRSEPRAQASYQARAMVPPEPGALHEEERIGSYGQPRWTAHRRFPTTRVYVRPEGEFAFEWWLETKLDLDDLHNARYRSDYEVEFGLGHRMQVDLYLETEQLGHQGTLHTSAEKVELRYALADWGVIAWNPTLYVEYVRQDAGPPKLEFKVLAGDELARRVHFGLNAIVEHELGGAQQNEYALATGLSYSLSDAAFSLGAELKLETVDNMGARLTFDNWEALLGPSLAWSPTPPMHLLLVALLGNETTRVAHAAALHTPIFEPTLILGWEL